MEGFVICFTFGLSGCGFVYSSTRFLNDPFVFMRVFYGVVCLLKGSLLFLRFLIKRF